MAVIQETNAFGMTFKRKVRPYAIKRLNPAINGESSYLTAPAGCVVDIYLGGPPKVHAPDDNAVISKYYDQINKLDLRRIRFNGRVVTTYSWHPDSMEEMAVWSRRVDEKRSDWEPYYLELSAWGNELTREASVHLREHAGRVTS